MKNEKLLEKIIDSHCSVLGFGISNIPLVRFLLSLGTKKITVHDKKDFQMLGDDAVRLAASGVEFVTGEQYLDDIRGDVIFRSPGIRPDKPGILAAIERGALLTSEMELFFELTPARIIGITGSDGKTTTTTLVSLILSRELEKRGKGHVFLGGNIGEPLLPHVREMTEDDFAVVELSSFQLFTMKHSAYRAVITNLSPNHLDWHTGMDEYAQAKLNICSHPENTLLVTNAGNPTTREMAKAFGGNLTLFTSGEKNDDIPAAHKVYEKNGCICLDDGKKERQILRTADIRLVGRHNVENYMAAIGVLDGLADAESVLAVAREFGGVEHRLEFVREMDGVKYYNSSIDSSPTRTAAALSALPVKPVIICGGYDKNIPFDSLGTDLCEKTKAVILTGATAGKIREAIEKSPAYRVGILPVYTVDDFEGAVEKAREEARRGDIVILSPACASFDRFRNFEERGRYFKKIVNAWSEKK